MAEQKVNRPFGLWSSPISPQLLGLAKRLENPQFDPDGRLFWLEGRAERGVLVSRPAGEAALDLTEEHSVRGRVGYGGGEYALGSGLVVFAEQGGRLYRRSLNAGQPTPITPPFGSAASPALSPDGRWVAYVFSDGKDDLLALVDVEGRQWPLKLAQGADFYMHPAWHPAGKQLAWVEWDHPNMPWDGTRLMLGQLGGDTPRILDRTLAAGGPETPVCQPAFSPDGRWLSYIVSSGEWEDLVLIDLQAASGRMRPKVLIHGDGFHLCEPAWIQGLRWYGWAPDSQRIYYLRNAAEQASLWSVDLSTGHTHQIDTSPYTWLSGLSVSPAADEVVFWGSAPTIPGRILRWEAASQRLQIEARSSGESLAPEFLPSPRPITWQAPNGTPVHGLYFPPANPGFSAEGLPPAIIHIHGGPTSQTPVTYLAESAYFTSRGYGYLVVNYRGSSGYGRSYRDALRQRWGEVDVEDACGGAQALAALGLADPGRLVIEGGSAGGYTVLNALIRQPGLFKAGICEYGVSNLFNLARDTHKFELHYLDSMVGPLPESAQRYHAWSPVFHADRIRDPLAVFQGKEDKVVPPAQAEEIVAALRRGGVPHIYRLYDGEGHGFRKRETIIDYLQETERFLQQHVLFSA
ncbi:MAG TPA: prolyl oligopeptidase family serine peptidase [Polyangia bacterium]